MCSPEDSPGTLTFSALLGRITQPPPASGSVTSQASSPAAGQGLQLRQTLGLIRRLWALLGPTLLCWGTKISPFSFKFSLNDREKVRRDVSGSRCGQAGLAQFTCQDLGNFRPSTLATVLWRDSSFIPATADSDVAQQGSHCTPLPQCSTWSQQGTRYLFRGTRLSLWPRTWPHLLDPPSRVPTVRQDEPLSSHSQLPWVPLSAGADELSFVKFTWGTW